MVHGYLQYYIPVFQLCLKCTLILKQTVERCMTSSASMGCGMMMMVLLLLLALVCLVTAAAFPGGAFVSGRLG